MADKISYDKTYFGNTVRSRTAEIPRKGAIDVFPQQFYLQCGYLEIRSDGTPQNTRIFIDGKPAKGIYSVRINFNTQKSTKIELGIFMDSFEFQLRPRKES